MLKTVPLMTSMVTSLADDVRLDDFEEVVEHHRSFNDVVSGAVAVQRWTEVDLEEPRLQAVIYEDR